MFELHQSGNYCYCHRYCSAASSSLTFPRSCIHSRLWQLRSPTLLFKLYVRRPLAGRGVARKIDAEVPPGGTRSSLLALLRLCVCVRACVHVQPTGSVGRTGSSGLRLLGWRLSFKRCRSWCVSFTMLPLPACIPLKKEKNTIQSTIFLYVFLYVYIHTSSQPPTLPHSGIFPESAILRSVSGRSRDSEGGSCRRRRVSIGCRCSDACS